METIIENIVVPVDFSPESLNGLRMALLFSRTTRTKIHLLYVLQKSIEYDSPSEDEKLRAELKFKQLISEHQNLLGTGSEIVYLISRGRVYNEVVSLADKLEDCIISASTHGASGFQELFIGSNAFRIISTTDKPVITMRKNCCPDSIKTIVMPIDLSVDTRQKVPVTTEIANLFGATIHVVGIQTSRSKINQKKIRAYVSQAAAFIESKVKCESNEVFGDNISDLLLNYAATVKADMISITTEKSSGLSLIMGNTAHQVLNKAEIPVLCLPPRQITKAGSFSSMG